MPNTSSASPSKMPSPRGGFRPTASSLCCPHLAGHHQSRWVDDHGEDYEAQRLVRNQRLPPVRSWSHPVNSLTSAPYLEIRSHVPISDTLEETVRPRKL